MKILIAAAYIYDVRYSEFGRNQSGYGYMVKDIAESLASDNEVGVLTHVFTKKINYINKFKIIKHTYLGFFKGLRVSNIIEGIKYALKFNVPISIRIRYLFYFSDKGAIMKAIKEYEPDIVHVNGGTYQTLPYIEACEKLKIPYVVTLHGLNGVSENNNALYPDRKLEYEIIKHCCDKSVPLTVVSSGCKKQIEEIYHIKSDNIKVILNGTSYEKPHDHNLKKNAIIVVGTISQRKNQMFILKSIEYLREEFMENAEFYFFGNDISGVDFKSEISRSKYKSHIHYNGFVEREELGKIWEISKLNIVASLEEGFGLSMIEGFTYGVPTLTFSDLEAVSDLYSSEAMSLVDRTISPEEFAKEIETAYAKEWDAKKIILHSNKFSAEKMAEKYNKIFSEAIEEYRSAANIRSN